MPSGEKVQHFPPDDAHPEGKMVLIRESSSLRDQLNGSLEDHQAAQEELEAQRRALIEAKQADQAIKGLPHEKSAL